MVDYITGINGIGKSKILVETAIETVASSKGNVVFIDCGKKLERLLPSNIRFINVNDYMIESAMSFYGFLIGICAGDYDITDIFIDSTLKIIPNQEENIEDFFKFLSGVSASTGVNFHFSVCDKYVPELMYQGAEA
ncbi:MAG: hypothetical protein NC397_09040 [Clostridium sp.]|nr:hypothetical protein [Clostridium sp.]